MPKDTYQSLLKELQAVNKQIAKLNKNVKSVRVRISDEGDKVKMNKTRRKISKT
jgi:predicted  nucleic acid-binding Zn-ribbon protein